MGVPAVEIPTIDAVGPHVSFISGVTFERSGEHVLVSVYLETKIRGVQTREIVSKYVMTQAALATSTMDAAVFMKECVASPVMGKLARH